MKDLIHFVKLMAVEMTASTGQLFQAIPRRGERSADLKGAGAWLHVYDMGARIEITGSHPRKIEYLNGAPSITVSADRDPAAIARDIVRRLLPDAQAYLAKCHAHTRQRKDEADRMRVTMHRLSPYLTESTWNSDHWRRSAHAWHVSADVYPDRILELKLSDLPIETAIQIFELLGTKNPKLIKLGDNEND